MFTKNAEQLTDIIKFTTALHSQKQAVESWMQCRQSSTTDTDDCYVTYTVCTLQIGYNAHHHSNFEFIFHLMTVGLLSTAGFEVSG